MAVSKGKTQVNIETTFAARERFDGLVDKTDPARSSKGVLFASMLNTYVESLQDFPREQETSHPRESTGPDFSKLQELADSHGLSMQGMIDALVAGYGRASYEGNLTAEILAAAGAHATRQDALDILKTMLRGKYGAKACFSSSAQADPVKEECRGVHNRVRAKLKYELNKTKPTD